MCKECDRLREQAQERLKRLWPKSTPKPTSGICFMEAVAIQLRKELDDEAHSGKKQNH
jgi:hypothetical protein